MTEQRARLEEILEPMQTAIRYLDHVKCWSTHGPADINAEVLAEKLANAVRAALDNYFRLKKLEEKVGEWKERADNLWYSDFENAPWVKAISKFLVDIRNFDLGGEEGK